MPSAQEESPAVGTRPAEAFAQPWLPAERTVFEGGYSRGHDGTRYAAPHDQPAPVRTALGVSWAKTSRGAARVGALADGGFFSRPAAENRRQERQDRDGIAEQDRTRLRPTPRVVALLLLAPLLITSGFAIGTFTAHARSAAPAPGLDVAHVVDATDSSVTLQVRVPRAATAGDSYDLLVPKGFQAQAPQAAGADLMLIAPPRGMSMVVSSHPTRSAPPLPLTGRSVSTTVGTTTARGVQSTRQGRAEQTLEFRRGGVWYVVQESVPAATSARDLTLLDAVLRQWHFLPAASAGS